MHCSGHAVGNAAKNVFLVDEIIEHVGLYTMEERRKIKTFEVPHRRDEFSPKQVALAEECTVIACGTDHGTVVTFDRKTGERLQTLATSDNRHAIQSILVRPRILRWTRDSM